MVAIKKPSEYFNRKTKIQESLESTEESHLSGSFDAFKNIIGKIDVYNKFADTLEEYNQNVEKVNILAEQINGIQDEISNLLKREDLETAMLSQLVVVDESIRQVQQNVKSLNERQLKDVKQSVKNIEESVQEFLEVEVPKYKKLVFESESRLQDQYETLDENLKTSLEEISFYVTEQYKNLTETLESINEKSITTILEDFNTLTNQEYRDSYTKRVADLEANLLINEKHIKDYNRKVNALENEIKESNNILSQKNQNIKSIQESVASTISKLQLEKLEEKNYQLSKKIKYLEEVFEKFNEQTLTEGLLNEPPSVKTQDPLTPLDQNFVTLDQLQSHYRQFINRIQQQLATLGGGGETRLKYLDDIVGIATNAAAYDDKYLKYNHTLEKFEFSEVTGGIRGIGIGTTTIPLAGVGVTTILFTGSQITNVSVEDSTATVLLNGKPFPIGDYGDMINIRDAFGIPLGNVYDCLIYPEETLETVDLGSF